MLALLEGLENDVLGVGHAAHELHHAVDAVVFEDVCAVEWTPTVFCKRYVTCLVF